MRRLMMWLVVLGVSLSLATGCCLMGEKKEEGAKPAAAKPTTAKPATATPAPPTK